MLRGLSTIVAGLLLTAPFNADAVESLSTEELKSHCDFFEDDPEGKDGIFCVRYVQGFIDGAVATDERVTYNVANEYDREETFTERAIRTRLGQRIERFGPSYYAEFCLGQPLPLKTVVQSVVNDLLNTDRVANQPLARDFVYTTLRQEFPCEAPEEE